MGTGTTEVSTNGTVSDSFVDAANALNDHLGSTGDTRGLILLHNLLMEMKKITGQVRADVAEIKNLLPFSHADRRIEFRETPQMQVGTHKPGDSYREPVGDVVIDP